ncbi:Transmembrane protein 94 [Babesia sp. Xinjiang]|uniref:Transmembrane protein 94 n=1 Tax=Babesia sp. Xinjiang TaxID=462227 RepID=UPI000A235112|nr:Transmembrane protein 94 [Babesia sp. Xinjiang]ORM40114.1 Transmembrane protein 94 [Babesia sp. Xinjiang]
MAKDADATSSGTHQVSVSIVDQEAVNSGKTTQDGANAEGDASSPRMDHSFHPTIGLSTEDVNQRIITLITESLQKHEEHATGRSYLEPLLTKDLCFGTIAFIGIFTVLLAEKNHGRTTCFVYLVFLLAWLTLNAFVKITTKRIRNARVAERVKDVLNSFSNDIVASLHAELEQKRFAFDPANSVLIPVYRNREWKRLPSNVLVLGDVFKLKKGEIFPCDCRLIVSCDSDGNLKLGGQLLKFGDVCTYIGEPKPNVEFIDGSFVAQSDAMVPQLQAFLDCKRYGNPFINLSGERNIFEPPIHGNGETYKNSVWDLSDSTYFSRTHITTIEFLVYILLSVFVALAHVLTNESGAWRNTLFVTSTLFVCFAFPGFEPLVQLADIWGNVKLQSLFNWYNEKRLTVDICPQLSSSSSSSLNGYSKAGSVDSDMDANKIPLVNHLKELHKVMKRGLDSAGSLLNVLSSVTLLCFVDDVGLLTEGCATLQEIAIIKGNYVDSGVPPRSECDLSTDIEEKFEPQRTFEALRTFETQRTIETQRTFEAQRTKPMLTYEESLDFNETGDEFFREPSQCGISTTGNEHLVILDIYSDSSQFGKQYVRFNNEDERACRPQLLPLSFAMSVTQFPRYQPPSLFKLPPELIYTYVGIFANGDFQDFTDCLCTFTGSVGLKRSFSRRFRLLRFVVLIDEAHEPDGKLLLFFMRDPRKQIVQLFAKGKLEMLLERNLNYHNHQQGKILGVSRLMKRKLKELNMQWVSSGMRSFAYAYKPIHLDEFNMLMAHLDATTVFNVKAGKYEGRRKRRYMYLESATPISMQFGGECIYSWFKQLKKHDHNGLVSEPWYSVSRITKKRIIKGCVGDMVSACLKNTILLGMSASKRLYPKEVPSRIQSFHEAGVRFVYFSKHDERQTRVVGAHLGLETSWNSMISLDNSERSTYINQEGNVVLPSGIENIKRHIEEVDDIPLQVSLFANCKTGNTAEMLRILRNNGETIMCIGGGLRPSNFYVFREAHSSVSVAQGYHPVCRFCRGKRWSGVARAHIFDEALPEMKLSAALTSLPCDLQTSSMYKVADPYFVMEMLYEVFRVARHVSTNIQEAAAFLKLACHSLAWLLFLQSCVGLSEFIRPMDFAITLFVYVPMIAVSLLSNPADENIMQMLPNKIRREELRMKTKSMLRTYPRLCLVTTLTAASYCLSLIFVSRSVRELLLTKGLDLNLGSCELPLHIPLRSCLTKLRDAISEHQIELKDTGIVLQPDTPRQLAQICASVLLVLYMLTASTSWIDKYGDGGTGSWCNTKWLLMSFTVLVMHLLVATLRIYLWEISTIELQMFFPLKVLLIGTGLALVIVLFDQLIKLQMRRDRNIEQKFLRLLFATRLGMWSPK